MFKYLKLAPFLLVISVAAAQPAKTEFVRGSGFLRSSLGISVEFSLEISQRDPDDPTGWMTATFYSFPQHEFMTFESTRVVSLTVEKRTALVTGTAMVVDTRYGFQGEVEFSAVFEDLNSKKRRPRNDAMSLTLLLPTGTETFSGGIVPGDIQVGKRKR